MREFVTPYIFPLNPDYVAARSLRSLRSNDLLTITKSNRTKIQTYKVEEQTFGTPCIF